MMLEQINEPENFPKSKGGIGLKDAFQYPHPRPIAVDLFCGVGGLSLGFEQAGFDVVLAADRDGHHVAAHERNFPHGISLCVGVEDINADFIRKSTNISSDIDVVFGGPPCQGFSNMGKGDAQDPRNSLVGHYVRIVSELMPKAFVMENVPGMQSGNTKPFFDHTIKCLEEAGYQITTPVKTLNSFSFGVPQKRARLFVLGLRKDIQNKIEYPFGPMEFQPVRPSVAEAMDGLPEIEMYDELFRKDYLDQSNFTDPLSPFARVAMGIEKDISDLSHPRSVADQHVFGNKRTRHNEKSKLLYNATKPGEMVPGHKLPRLDPDGVAPTLRAGTEAERGSHTAPRPVHPFKPRCITVREAARLHGYPDWFAFYPAIHHGFRQVGNSVCPPVARAVGYCVRKALPPVALSNHEPEIISLSSEFSLPKDMKKSQRRIAQVDEYPKVVNFLFFAAFDSQTNKMKKSDFTFTDVERAISKTEAKMPRVRPERFIPEFAKARNAKKILSVPLEYGYSLMATDDGGSFVPIGTAGSIGSSQEVVIRSAEINNSEPFEPKASEVIDQIFELLEEKHLIPGVHSYVREKDLFKKPKQGNQFFGITCKNSSSLRGFLSTSTAKTLPKLNSIRKTFNLEDISYFVLSSELTSEHLLLSVWKEKEGIPVEEIRKIYLLKNSMNT